MTILMQFLRDDSGAVTIDWIALTAGILLLGIAVVYGIFEGGAGALATGMDSNLSTAVNVPEGTDTLPETSTFSAGD